MENTLDGIGEKCDGSLKVVEGIWKVRPISYFSNGRYCRMSMIRSAEWRRRSWIMSIKFVPLLTF